MQTIPATKLEKAKPTNTQTKIRYIVNEGSNNFWVTVKEPYCDFELKW